MNHHFDHPELLSLIEGDLDARAAELLKARLAKEPALAQMIERMKRDRAALRSLPEPELLVDFSAQLETILARPMLIEASEPSAAARPGEFRRQYRKRTARIRWNRLAFAATVLLAASLGVWAAFSNWSRPAAPEETAIVSHTEPATNDRPNGFAVASGETLAGIVHHYSPTQVSSDAMAHRSEVPVQHAAATDSPRKVQAEFAIVLHGSETSVVEDAVNSALKSLAPNAALVRNFSYEEAQRLTRDWRLASGSGAAGTNSGGSGLPLASHTLPRRPLDYRLLASQVRDAIQAGRRSDRSGEPMPVSESGTISGAAEFGPSLEQQLEFSSRGASFTVAVPGGQLSRFIEQLSLTRTQPTSLRMLPAGANDSEVDAAKLFENPMSLWLAEGSLARQSITQLERANADAIVLVPVMVQPRAERARR